jgi:Zinc carboxypeptidase/Secretion system C-terminal sorting domain
MKVLKPFFNQRAKILVLLLALIILPVVSSATPLLDIFLPSESSLVELKALGLDIIEEHETYVKVVGWPQNMSAIEQSGFAYQIDKENIEEFYLNRLANGSSLDELDDMGGYLTHDEALQQVLQLVADHPDLVSGPDTIGYTLENRPMWAFKISDNPGVDEDDEGEVFINGCIHAREVITPMVILNFANLLTDNYGTNQRITDIVDGREIWLMPIVNVDGYVYNEEHNPLGGGMWRKNRRVVDDIVRGVDLNRNFPTGWAFDDNTSSPNPPSETYRGASAASEPETQVIMDFVNAHEFNLSVNYHAYMNVTFIPMGYDFSDPPFHPSFWSVGSVYSESMGWPVRNVGINGNIIDWMADGADRIVYTILPEVGNNGDGFWPSLERQPILIEQQEEPLLAFCEHGDNPHKYQPPATPVVEALPDTVGAYFTLNWEAGVDSMSNPDVSYEIISLVGPMEIDNVEVESDLDWDLIGFTRSDEESHSGDYSYYSGAYAQAEHIMMTKERFFIEQGDTLRFWTNFNTDNGGIMLAQVDVGWMTFALEGNITFPNEGAQPRFAHLFGGNSEGWILAEFPLDSFVGYDAKFRFRYFGGGDQTDGGCYIDDITYISSYESSTVIATGITETSYEVDFSTVSATGERIFGVRSYNAEGIGGSVSDGVITYYDPTASSVVESNLPEIFEVGNAYPNPFNPSTSVNISLPETGQLTIRVHDLLGREVSMMDMGELSAGNRTINLDGSSWASGLYFINVDYVGTNGIHNSKVIKAMLLK